MKISLIAALSENRVIGKDNKLIWHIPDDLKHFKEITQGHPVIIGRKTFESIGKILPNRLNIVVSRDPSFARPRLAKLKVAQSLDQAIKIAKNTSSLRGSETTEAISRDRHASLAMTENEEEIFIIGGGQIFEQAIKIANKLYLTIIEGKFEGDTFFPDYSEFKKVVFEKSGEYQGLKYKFIELEK